LSDFTDLGSCHQLLGRFSDAFVGNPDQTPTFVIQAPCVEIFCTIDEPIRKLLPSPSTARSSRVPLEGASGSAIAEAIKSSAAEFSNRKEVSQFISEMGEQLKGAVFTSELKDTYKLVTESSETYQQIPGLGTVGQWVKENGADFFAKPTYVTESYEAPADDLWECIA
jgi:hypothetical protein